MIDDEGMSIITDVFNRVRGDSQLKKIAESISNTRLQTTITNLLTFRLKYNDRLPTTNIANYLKLETIKPDIHITAQEVRDTYPLLGTIQSGYGDTVSEVVYYMNLEDKVRLLKGD
jgi:hypothetical protein